MKNKPKVNLLKQNKGKQAEYIFIKEYNQYKLGDEVNDALRKNNGLFMHLKKQGIVTVKDDNAIKFVEEAKAQEQKAKELLEENERKRIVELKEHLLRDHYNKTLVISPELNKDLEFVRPLSYEIIVNKFKDICNLDSIKLITPNKDITLLGDYQIEVCINDEFEYTINVKVKERAIKGKAKAIGLKSTFVKDDNIILTSGSNANGGIEYYVLKDNSLAKKTDNPTFDVPKVNNEKIQLASLNKKKQAIVDNPTHIKGIEEKAVRQDYLEKKDQLEIEYFGRTFNDNLHIQLIYNILDIKKIFNLYNEDVIYVLQNLHRGNFGSDMVGTTNPIYNYSTLDAPHKDRLDESYKCINKYLSYFPQALSDLYTMKQDNKKMPKEVVLENKKIELLNIYRILSLARQYSKHGYYNFDELLDGSTFIKNSRYKDIIAKINTVYKTGSDRLHKGLVTNSRKNIYLIMQALGLLDKVDDLPTVRSIFKKYYDLSVCKSTSNLGFDLKKIRETIIDKAHIADLMEQNNKNQYYQIINYLVNEFITEDFINSIVNELRMASTANEKETIYLKYSSKLYSETKLKDIINADLIKNITEVKLRKDKQKDYFQYFEDKDIFTYKEPKSFFVKLVYFISCFLDVKSVNNLVTTLINKLININYFIDLIKNLNNVDKLGFTEIHKVYDSELIKELPTTLNFVLNLSKMQKNVNKLSKSVEGLKALNETMIKDAIYAFGGNDNSLKTQLELITNAKKEKQNKNRQEQSLRNFIYSKIVNSNIFRYLVEYSNPKECPYIIQNKKVVRFVLNTITPTEIDRYADSVDIDLDKTKQEKIEALINMLQDLNIENIVKDYKYQTSKVTNLCGLYLKVVYLVVKNLVNINSYYSIALSCLERDRMLYKKELGIGKDANVEIVNLDLVNCFLDKPNKFNKHNRTYITENCKYYNEIFEFGTGDKEILEDSFRISYRNDIAHINAIKNFKSLLPGFKKNTHFEMRSYFELYNYLIQKLFIKNYRGYKTKKHLTLYPSSLIDQYEKDIDEYSTYSKNMLHVINMPFAYNLARYKNLTIEDIFYDSYLDTYKFK